jgi:O-antigen biosynthesis protein WbqV
MSYAKIASKRINYRHLALECVTVCAAIFIGLFIINSLSGLPSGILSGLAITVVVATLHTCIHAALEGYNSSWRFFSLQDAKLALLSALVATAFSGLILSSLMPMAGWFLVGCAVVAGAIAPRLAVRIAHSHGTPSLFGFRLPSNAMDGEEEKKKQTLLMIGFGDHVADFIRAQNRADSEHRIAGVVHIHKHREAASLRGVPVLGSIDKLRGIIRRLASEGVYPDYLVLTRDEMSNRSVGEILSMTDKTGIPVAWLPRADHINSNLGQQLRPIKLDDLLPRSASIFDAQACGALLGTATVLVTGAGGSIGSELVRQIGSLAPTQLILTDASEHALYMIDQEIRRVFPSLSIVSKLLDVRDRDAVFRAMDTHRPDYVFHAAALKHVPIVEAQACEGVITNVIGSRNVADAAAASNVMAMVMVSTDKAVNPANVMGATKRLAEAYCQAMDAASTELKGATRFVTVRFGNVLGSNGSVVPLFQKQLAQGGPLTVTHPDVERFFMTIPEASRLILQALLLGVDDAGGDRGIFVLDMGEPVKIVDLARQVIRLSGLTPDEDVKIVYAGLRPGEKLYEELMHETENLVPTEHPNLMVARPRFVQIQTVRSQIDNINKSAKAGDSEEVLRLLKLYIPEFETTAREAKVVIDRSRPTKSRPEAV